MYWEIGLEKGSDEYNFAASKAERIRVLAGPGTGKSFCLNKRIIRIFEEATEPVKILALTFTSVAAEGLKKDIEEELGKLPKTINIKGSEIKVSTLHSLCKEILVEKGQLGANGSRVRVLQDFEIKTMLRDLEPDKGKIGQKREMLRYYEDDPNGTGPSDENGPIFPEYSRFRESLRNWLELCGGLVPGELVTRVCSYLKDNADERKSLAYDHVLVDEYQDLNKSEQELVELLTAENGCLAVIGDDDQSIYEFKGGSPDGIRQFPSKHPGCESFSFRQCYRCPKSIVSMANNLIKKNAVRDDKKFVEKSDFQLGDYKECEYNTPEEEVEGICELIKSELAGNPMPGKIVVLTPTRSRGKKMQQALLEANIPTTICFRDAVFDNKEAKDAFSKLSILAQPEDLISWRYLLGEDKGNCKAKSWSHIQNNATRGRTVLGVLNKCLGSMKIPHTASLVKRYRELQEELENLRRAVQKNSSSLVGTLCPSGDSAFSDILQKAVDDKADLVGKDDWLPEIRDKVLKEIYHPEVDPASKKVQVLSLHAAKGLSAPLVIIMSAIDDLMPIGNAPEQIEEQRRLFYVAITRCKGATKTDKNGNPNYPGKLVISYFTGSEESGMKYQKSRFIEEMDEKQ